MNDKDAELARQATLEFQSTVTKVLEALEHRFVIGRTAWLSHRQFEVVFHEYRSTARILLTDEG